jgi:hypothetical protein
VGRIDLIGNALIMVMIAALAGDHTRELHVLRKLRQFAAGVPATECCGY